MLANAKTNTNAITNAKNSGIEKGVVKKGVVEKGVIEKGVAKNGIAKNVARRLVVEAAMADKLGLQPKELNRSLRLDEALRNRNFKCSHYNLCLSKAASLSWQSFTCKECTFFNRKNHKENHRYTPKRQRSVNYILKRLRELFAASG